jgi:hypothetical protein
MKNEPKDHAIDKNVSIPRLDLTTFFLSISSAAYMGLGLVPMGPEGRCSIDLELARQNIDLLELLCEKTKGNRTPEEDRLIENLLFETRMRFVEVSKKATQNQ